MEDIKLRTVEETAAIQAADCLPKGIRLMVVGQRPIFVHRVYGRWIPVDAKLQEELAKKHIIS